MYLKYEVKPFSIFHGVDNNKVISPNFFLKLD